MSYLICLMGVCVLSFLWWVGLQFYAAWRDCFRPRNRRNHHIEIGFRTCKPQERK